ncbi:MAG: hypothetical protein ACYCWB_04920 [Thiobacillus sp.]
MRKSGVLLVLVSLLGLLGGCATTGGFPADPKDQALWYVERAAQQAEAGDFERVTFMLTEAASRPGGVDAAKDFLLKSPIVNTRLSDYFQQTSKSSTNKEELNNLARYVSTLSKLGVIKDAELLAKSIEDNVARKNSTGEVNWVLSDDISSLHTLQSAEAQKIIYERSLDVITDKQRPQGLAKALAEYLSKPERTPVDLSYAKQKLWKTSLRRTELQEFQRVFPDLVSARLADLTAYVQVNVTPSDRLMEEDLKEKIRQISSNYIVLKNGEQGNATTINVTVEKLRSEDRQLPSQSQTITYAQHDVDLFKAAFLMPRNASYMYEWKTGGVELEYGYVVHLNQNGKVLLDELIRGTITEKFVSCDNPRIVNVFGGTTRADFVANSDMSSRCSGATSSSPSAQDLKGRVLALLVDKIVSVEPLAIRRE